MSSESSVVPPCSSSKRKMREYPKQGPSCRNLPNPTEIEPSRIPSPQRERIKQRFIAGQSIRRISREEGRARETIDRVVKSADVADYVREMRARFMGLGDDAILAVHHAIREQGDARLAYEILKDIGVVPTRDEKQFAAMQHSVAKYDEETEVKNMMGRLIETAIQRASVYGTRCPELDAELERNGGRINYDTGRIELLQERS